MNLSGCLRLELVGLPQGSGLMVLGFDGETCCIKLWFLDLGTRFTLLSKALALLLDRFRFSWLRFDVCEAFEDREFRSRGCLSLPFFLRLVDGSGSALSRELYFARPCERLASSWPATRLK